MDEIMLVGDTHGDVGCVVHALRLAADLNINTVVQLGDFGFTHVGKRDSLANLSSHLVDSDQQLWWVDGNHEDFDNLGRLGATPDDAEPTEIAPNIHYLPRGYVWVWGGVRFMSFGGAVSVDKLDRTEGFSWWPQEEITQAQVDRTVGIGEVDVLLTHDAPDCPSRLLGVLNGNRSMFERMYGFDEWAKLEAESRQNRLKVNEVIANTSPSVVVHGHYHCSYVDSMANIEIHGLNCNAAKGFMRILSLNDLSMTS